MINIIGYTDSVNKCDCCGKTELKGTYCVEVEGVELYYGSVCAFKNHGITKEEQKEAKAKFTKEQKNKKLYDLHIVPLKLKLAEKIEETFTTNYENLTGLTKKCYDQLVESYQGAIEFRAKKYKIAL